MRISAAARRYARALFALAQEQQAVAEVRDELGDVEALFAEHPELAAALFRPLHPVAERRGVLRGICERAGCGESVRNFFAFLVDQRRLVDFDAICSEYRRLADEAAGRTRAEVVSASPLSDEQQQRLAQALGARTGCEVELDVRVDADLIGGAIAVVGGLVFDGSLRTQLSQLRETLTRGH